MAPAPHTQHSPIFTMPNSSPTTAHSAPTINGDVHAPKDHHLSSPSDTVSAPVNRKKQKRRQKQAARLAERQLANGHLSTDDATQNGSSHANPEGYHSDDGDADDADQEQPTNGDAYHKDGQDSMNAHIDSQNPQGSNSAEGSQKSTGRKSKKKKGKKVRNGSHAPGDETSTPMSTPSVSMSHPLPPPLPSHLASHSMLKSAKNRSIWNTSTQEERENIKTFWLELGEEERRQLVKVEKDAVLKKMKEQQRHSCSCTVCGRKRTAIEEELEVLYDAYYEELEQYANHNQGSFEKGSPMVPPPRLYQPPLRSPGQHTRTQGQFHPSRGRINELTEEDDDLEEDYDEEEEEEEGDEPYSDEELDEEDEETRAARADFFAFGNSLTVKDGILTVADDLLKNDGKHFIDMMEQLAERRMQREEDTQYGIAAAHESLHSGHNHGPFDDEDYDDEDDEDYDSQEEEDYEEDEMVCPGDAMTEEQRMEEGRRMFQIFAARMFEQRVLTAYREKVAEQRQQKLIEELMEEETRNEQRNAKKAREAQKRKDKKRLQKQAKEEERARREAEKAAEEAAAKAEQEKKLEEQRKKREEQRKKKEAERKAQEEERARKEAEKLRRQREERERQAEAERKQREEKKRREEARRKEKEERELREKKAKEERDRKAQEEQAKKDTAKRGEEAKDHEKRDNQAKRLSPQGPVPIPPDLQHLQGFSPAVAYSPHVQTATPVVPKAPTPARPRQPSQQDSHSSSSPHSQPPSTDPSQASLSPRSMPVSQSSGVASGNSKQGHGLHAMLHQSQPSTPVSPLGRSIPPGFSSVNGIPPNPPGLSGMVARPPVGHDLPSYPPHSGAFISPFRGYPAPNGIPAPPGINGARPMPTGRGFPLEPGHGFAFHGQQQIPGAFPTQQGGLPHRHSRQPSGSFERSPLESVTQPMPISRPSPIKRPSSGQQDQRKGDDRTTQREVDDLSAHLGSSALLDDTDVPLSSNLSQSLPGATAPGSFPVPARASFGGPSLFPDPLSASKHTNFPVSPAVSGGTWGAQIPFGTSAFPSAQTWGTGPASGWSNNAFGSGGHHRAHTSRPVAIRLLVIQACKQLNSMSPFKGVDGYHEVNLVLRQVEQLRPPNEPSISLKEMLDICDTEGNTQNGGGTFSIKKDETGEFVKFEPDNNSAASGHRGSIVPGEIGSPVPSSSLPAFGGIGTPSVLRQYSSPPMGF